MKTRKPPMDARNEPVAPPPVEPNLNRRRAENVELVTETREYELITPLFGGGVNPAEADPVTIIRGPSVRGQLRFWWRACRAAGYANIDQLKMREDQIWGSTNAASMVSLDAAVDENRRGNPETAFEVISEQGKNKVRESPKVARYAAFPLQPDKNEQKILGWKSESVVTDVHFSLRIQCPAEFSDDVKAALWAWETFGGIGARVRRGFGALHLLRLNSADVTSLPADKTRIEQWLHTSLSDHVAGSALQDPEMMNVPHLRQNHRFKLTGFRRNPLETWKYLINQLNSFRQDRYGSKFGMSKWPEANAIRARTSGTPRFAEQAPNEQVIDKFPRAVFGLPIIFHMPHDKGLPETTLRGMKSTRLASPLILRPLVCEGGQSCGLAIILETPRVPADGLLLEGGASNEPIPEALLETQEARVILPLAGNPDVLEAFLAKLE